MHNGCSGALIHRTRAVSLQSGWSSGFSGGVEPLDPLEWTQPEFPPSHSGCGVAVPWYGQLAASRLRHLGRTHVRKLPLRTLPTCRALTMYILSKCNGAEGGRPVTRRWVQVSTNFGSIRRTLWGVGDVAGEYYSWNCLAGGSGGHSARLDSSRAFWHSDTTGRSGLSELSMDQPF